MFKPTLVAFLLAGLALAGCTTKEDSDSATDVASQLHAAYKDQPFKGGQETPDHEWSFVDAAKTHISFLHWMEHDGSHDAETATELFATGDGFKGTWCKGDSGVTDEQISAGYVHFHKESSPNWDAGHGATDKNQVGYWLRHVAAKGGVEMMPGVVSKAGQVYPLMPSTSNLPECEGGVDDGLAEQLHAAYNDQPFTGGQDTPDHEWSFIDATRNRITFLHWMGHGGSHDAETATELFATGDGFKGTWCLGTGGITQAQIDAGYVHFHKESSANWDAGHGGTDKAQVGFWLRHVAAVDGVEMMPGVVSKAGEVYPLMPSTASLPAC